MELTDMTVKQFSDVVASDAPAPGGGSVAALEGAVGASLIHMVAVLTTEKKRYKEHEILMAELMQEAERLRIAHLDTIERDTQAFNKVSAVFAMPKGTEEERELRKAAMQEALMASTLTPFEIMTLSMKVLELAQRAVGKSNASAASDLGVAALSLKAAIQGAWLNILINISGITDKAFAEKYRAEGEAILKRTLPIADGIYEDVQALISRQR